MVAMCLSYNCIILGGSDGLGRRQPAAVTTSGGGVARLRRGFSRSRSRLDTPLGTTEPRFLARWIGTLLIVATLVGAATTAFPEAAYADVPVSIVTCVLAATLGLSLLLGAFDNAPLWAFQIVCAAGSGLAGLGVYSGGAPQSGAQIFYVWISPYAFAFFSKRAAALQVAFIGISYGVVLAIQKHIHPGIASAGLDVGIWIPLVATSIVVGVMIRRIARALRDVDRRVRRAFVDSPIGATLLSLDLTVLSANLAFCKMVGRTFAEVENHSILDFAHPDDRARVRAVVANLGEETVEYEQRYLLPDADVVWSSVSIARITPEVGQPYLFCQSLDITAHKRDREALATQAIHDPLTGLYNRMLFLDRLGASLRSTESPEGRVAVVMLDLDRFKIVNDSLGHPVGDQLLAEIAPRLLRATGPSDTVARFGGDEFVLLCEGVTSTEDAERRAEALLRALRLPVELPIGSFTIGASVGIAIASSSAANAHDLIRDADAALYRAKAGGRNQVRLFDESMRSEALSRLALEDDLRTAISNDELHLVYQPVVDQRTGEVVMIEALARWHHRTRGLLLPDEFIPLAEETGLINELGDWVLSTSLAHLRHWQQLPHSGAALMCSVNVSGIQLADQRFAQRVFELARINNVDPHSVGIEVTESVLIANDQALDTLERLRGLGCVILLDDFGTGYSSLSYLEQFDVDMIKVDRSFIAGIGESPERRIVLEAILAMCKALGLRVVAEGVEETEQAQQLDALGCRLIQGYIFSPPLAPDEIDRFVIDGIAVPHAAALRNNP
jgi:diguanylate cyclase (GGDEF)-like protein/PAS domain S-box-containing protein